jgi:hypothetical protein
MTALSSPVLAQEKRGLIGVMTSFWGCRKIALSKIQLF